MRRKKNTIFGFSLTETLVYMGVFVFVLTFLTWIFSSMIDQQQEVQTISVVQQDGEYIMARLMYDIARADNILTPTSAGEQSQVLQLLIGADTYTYSLTGSTLNLNDGVSNYRLNSYNTDVSAVNFQRIGNDELLDSIKSEFTVSSVVQRVSGAEVRTFSVTAGLR